VVACAVGDGIDMGVDVELIGRSGEADDVAARLFSPSEGRDLGRLAPPDRHVRFIELWSLKEAYLTRSFRSRAMRTDEVNQQ
jgi:4'-phosphopantetheinyl transferase